jgi:hypothetical protein
MLRPSGFAIQNGIAVGALCDLVGARETISCVPSEVEEEDVCGDSSGNGGVVDGMKSGGDGARAACGGRRDSDAGGEGG